jgi:hypothetical protein
MRSKGMLVWNAVTQIEYTYTAFVDAIALEAIGYKYYAVYLPLVVIQWFLLKFCELTLTFCISPPSRVLAMEIPPWRQDADEAVMVETFGYTLEEIAFAFDRASTDSLTANTLLDRQLEAGKGVKGQAGEEQPEGRLPSDEYK